MKLNMRMPALLLLCFSLFVMPGCAGTIIETATDAAVAVAKIPFKVGAGIVDVITDDDEPEEKNNE